MTGWTYTYHRFADRAAFLAACDALAMARDEQDNPLPPVGVALDVIGTIWTGGTLDPESGIMVGQTEVPGYHVNAAWHESGMPASWAASLVTPDPVTPTRVWA